MNDIPRNNFNDYLQTSLLAANLSAQWRTQRTIAAAAAAEASHRELSRWERVVRHRYPHVTDPIEIEDMAEQIMGFDQMETQAQHHRDMGLHLPQKAPLLRRILGSIGLVFLGMFGYFILEQRAQREATYSTGTFNRAAELDPAEAWAATQPWGWVLVIVIFIWIVWYLSGAFVPQASNYHPQDDSLICQTVYPGRKLRTKSGKQIVVASDRLPRYEPRRLSFLVPTTDGLMYSSDDILWDDQASSRMQRSLDS